jgi:23S rRNA pseudouridine1911/1915/1917 synthase
MTSAADIQRYQYVVVDPNPNRLDAYLAGITELASQGLSRSRLHALTVEGCITVNGQSTRPAQRLHTGDIIVVTVPPARLPTDLLPQDIPVGIVYQDDDIVVVDKPAGLSVHPGPGHPDGTLVNALLARCPDIRGVGGEIRPGIVHRLDLDTSGLLVVAKNQLAHQHLTEQMKNRTVSKQYQAVAVGIVTPEADTIDGPIGRHPYHRQRMAVVEDGRAARTHYQTEATVAGHTSLSLSLETGRTHQIRVHLAHRRFPILGDAVYGRASELLDRQFLHAARLALHHPATGQWMEFNAPLPLELAQAWDRLRNIPARSA